MYKKWQSEHNRLARAGLNEIKKGFDRKNISASLPKFSTNLMEWVAQARPTVEGITRSFLTVPFWSEIYNDDFHSTMIMGGRQIYKTTYITDLIAYEATTKLNAQICYVTFSRESASSFSGQKLRIGTFMQNPRLAVFLRKGEGNVREISLKNGSTIYCTIHTDGYKNVEGKSIAHCFLDEAQYQTMEYAQKVIQTMMATKGKLTVCGIGGMHGSAYQAFWDTSDQREWIYDDPYWRTKLQFDQYGLVHGDYMKDILRGRWVSQKPENTLFHGYHIPQTIFPTIPLTEEDARLLYKVNPMFSIEYLKKKNAANIFTTHTLGEFYNSVGRPITPAMVLACMNPYRNFRLVTPQEISDHRDREQDSIKIGLGVDWGSGNPSSTVIAIIIRFATPLGQYQYHLAFLDKRPSENQMDQGEFVNKLLRLAKCDVGVGDLGYGANQVKIVQDGGYSRQNGEHFEGVGSMRFLGCRTISNQAKPVQYHKKVTDEHGQETSRIDIDKTSAIEKFIDLLGSSVTDPSNKEKTLPKFIIPFKNEHEVDWLINDFTSITRKDLAKTEFAAVDPRQNARKEFNHPKDSVMAIIYAMCALELDHEWRGGSIPPARRWKE